MKTILMFGILAGMPFVLGFCSLLSTLCGGVVAHRARDRLHLVLGAAAGVMLGVVAFDLVPEAMRNAGGQLLGVPAAMVALMGGFFTVHVIERSLGVHAGHEAEFGDHAHPGHAQSVGMLAGGGLVVHSVLDGVGIGLGFRTGTALGVAVAVAVIAHDFADGFNTVTIPTLYGNARRRAMTLLGLDALAPIVGVAIGTYVPLPASATGVYLGYFAGFLLYLATADILPEAHAGHPSRITLLVTIAGAAFMWVAVGLTN